MKLKFNGILPGVLVIIFCLIPGFDTKRGDESKYTKAEKQALVKLRKLVKNELYEDYMHRDEYLIPWLRTRQLDVDKAADLLLENLKWRKEEKIDDLANEEFPQYEKTYPTDLVARDKEGRPVMLSMFSSWDVRKAAISGNINSLKRYMIKNLFEMPQQVARKEGQADGTNGTQFIIIVDLGGYNLRQHACVRCLEIPMTYIQTYESHYPQSAWQTLTINTPTIFDPVLTLTRPFFSDHLSKTLYLLTDKSKWKEHLDGIISPDQLPARFGGTHKRKH